MKKLSLIIIILFVLSIISCNNQHCNNGVQDGDETGVDCGGSCSPCPSNPPTGGGGGGNNNATLAAIQGLWDFDYSVDEANGLGFFYSGASSKVDLTNTQYVVGGNPVPDMYESFGTINTFSYPSGGAYTFNSSNNSVDNNFITSVNSNEMILQYGSTKYYYSKQSFIPTSYSWEITFDVIPVFANNMANLYVNENGTANYVLLGQPVTQLTYSGSVNIGSPSTGPSLSLQFTGSGALSNNVNINVKLKADSRTIVDKDYFFPSGSNVSIPHLQLSMSNL